MINTRIRMTLGVIAGLVLWWFLFYLSIFVFGFLWPALSEAAQPVAESGDFSQLTTPMLLLFLLMYFWVNPAAGWLTALIGQNRKGVWMLATLLFLFAAFQHYYALWNNLANWYNVLVPILIPPLIYLGSLLASTKNTPAQ